MEPTFYQAPEEIPALSQLPHCLCQGSGVSRGNTHAIDAIEAVLTRSSYPRGNDRTPARHGFQGHQPKGLVLDHARKEGDVGLLVVLAHLPPRCL